MWRAYRLIFFVCTVNTVVVQGYHSYYDKYAAADNVPALASYDDSIARITVPPFYGNDDDTNFNHNGGAAGDSNDDANYTPKAEYSFSYGVDDPDTGNSHGRYETRDGDVVRGEYSLVEPDGFLRKVYYTSDPKNGFRATVEYVPPPETAAGAGSVSSSNNHYDFDHITFPSSPDDREFPSSPSFDKLSYDTSRLTSSLDSSSPTDEFRPAEDIHDKSYPPHPSSGSSSFAATGGGIKPYSHHYQFNDYNNNNNDHQPNSDPSFHYPEPAPVTHENDYDYVQQQNTDRTTVDENAAVDANEYDDSGGANHNNENDDYIGATLEQTHPLSFNNQQQQEQEDETAPEEEEEENEDNSDEPPVIAAPLQRRTGGRPSSFIYNSNHNNHYHPRNNNNNNGYSGSENRKYDTNIGPSGGPPTVTSTTTITTATGGFATQISNKPQHHGGSAAKQHRRQRTKADDDDMEREDNEDDIKFPPIHPLAKPVDVIEAPDIDIDINDSVDSTSHLTDDVDEMDDERK